MVDKQKVEQAIRLLLEGIGEDITREGLIDTPDRIARMCEEIYGGLDQEADHHLLKQFPVENNEIVLEKNITFYSMCEHHLMPFFGKAHVAYIPKGEVVGLSKIARTVEVFAKRPQLQEQLTAQIADAINEQLHPMGVMVMLEAEHTCMTMRGIKKPGSQIGKLENNLDDLSKRLYKAKIERENQEQLRMDFFANVSHELRTPITVMRGYTETLNDGVITDEAMVNEYYRKMLTECRSMERLVGDLFILSKMQNPDFKIEKEPVSIRQVFGDVLRSAREIARKKNITITQKLSVDDEEPCMILGDDERRRQMFMIIVDNAVKFSYESGEIIISIEKRVTLKKQAKIYISIQDFGVGISKEALPYIFEKFYKSKLKQNQKGTGLGLMIAKQIALRHGCDIMVESEIEQGTKFAFEFEECVSMDEYE